jgi:hypothetical protein
VGVWFYIGIEHVPVLAIFTVHMRTQGAVTAVLPLRGIVRLVDRNKRIWWWWIEPSADSDKTAVSMGIDLNQLLTWFNESNESIESINSLLTWLMMCLRIEVQEVADISE